MYSVKRFSALEENELEQREFGKYDKLLAERNNIDITTLRNQRVGFQGTGTVNDIINARSGQSGFVSTEFGANSDLSDFGKKSKKGVDFGVRNVNEDQLSRYKKLKERTKGDSQKAYKKLKNANLTNMNEAENFESIANSRAQGGRAIAARSYQNQVKQNQAPTAAGTVSQDAAKATSENVIKDTAKTAAQESTQKTAQVTNQVNKNGSGMLKRGMEWASKNKVGLGIAAGTAALAGGGAYLYNKAKKKDQDKDNNNQ
jgi:hypothetical protein